MLPIVEFIANLLYIHKNILFLMSPVTPYILQISDTPEATI